MSIEAVEDVERALVGEGYLPEQRPRDDVDDLDAHAAAAASCSVRLQSTRARWRL